MENHQSCQKGNRTVKSMQKFIIKLVSHRPWFCPFFFFFIEVEDEDKWTSWAPYNGSDSKHHGPGSSPHPLCSTTIFPALCPGTGHRPSWCPQQRTEFKSWLCPLLTGGQLWLHAPRICMLKSYFPGDFRMWPYLETGLSADAIS